MNRQLLETTLRQTLPAGVLLVDEPMARHTTFEIGGPAAFFVEAASVQHIVAALTAARQADAPSWVLGCGSNVLVTDDGLQGVVVHIGQHLSDVRIDGTTITAQAGATNEQVARAACDAGLAGYEFASGIPGSIGGAAIMNAGAYDGEFKDVATGVRCLAPSLDVVEITAAEAAWGYRRSMMMDKGFIVLEATLTLAPDDSEAIGARMDDLRQRRESKQPLELPSAGSTFKRPAGHFAGKLIQDAGMRGHAVGAAQVSTKHTGFVVNTGHATAADVRAVIADVQRAVLETQGVHLEPEVRQWGF